jgi:uncharacterized protein
VTPFSRAQATSSAICRHLSALDRAVAEGALKKPLIWDPLQEILWKRGLVHEQSFLDHLTKSGLEVVKIEGVGVTDAAVAETVAGMKSGVPVIAQAALSHDGWVGRADILRRVEVPSGLGDWSYDAIAAKLRRQALNFPDEFGIEAKLENGSGLRFAREPGRR